MNYTLLYGKYFSFCYFYNHFICFDKINGNEIFRKRIQAIEKYCS